MRTKEAPPSQPADALSAIPLDADPAPGAGETEKPDAFDLARWIAGEIPIPSEDPSGKPKGWKLAYWNRLERTTQSADKDGNIWTHCGNRSGVEDAREQVRYYLRFEFLECYEDQLDDFIDYLESRHLASHGLRLSKQFKDDLALPDCRRYYSGTREIVMDKLFDERLRALKMIDWGLPWRDKQAIYITRATAKKRGPNKRRQIPIKTDKLIERQGKLTQAVYARRIGLTPTTFKTILRERRATLVQIEKIISPNNRVRVALADLGLSEDLDRK